jgi:hypothetical protein
MEIIKRTEMPTKVQLRRLPPTLNTNHHIEYSIHECPKSLLNDLKLVFPKLSLDDIQRDNSCINENITKNVYIIPTFQKSEVDLVGTDHECQLEKDRLLEKVRCIFIRNYDSYFFEQFFRWGIKVVNTLNNQGYWADIIDPSSGHPVLNIFVFSILTKLA